MAPQIVPLYLEKFYAAQKTLQTKFIWNPDPFKTPYKILINSFLDSKILAILQALNIDLLICDSSNFLCNFVAEKLNITKKIFHSSSVPSPYWTDYIDISSTQYPVVVSPYNNNMGLGHRFLNFINYISVVTWHKSSKRGIQHPSYSTYDPEATNNTQFLDSNSLYTTTAVRGLSYPVYLPPNVVNLGCISCVLPQQLPVELDTFLSAYTQNIYIKIDIPNNSLTTRNILETIEELKKVGFVIKMSFTKGIKLPENAYKVEYVPTADILAHGKVVAFVHDSEWTSIIEGVYYKKPMLALSHWYDRKANGAFVEYRELGVNIENQRDMSKKNILRAIKSILEPKATWELALDKYSRIAVGVDSIKQAEKLIEGYLTNGAEHLVVKDYHEMPFYAYYNLDVWTVFAMVPLVLICVLYFGCYRIVRRWRGKQKLQKVIRIVKEMEVMKEKDE